MQENQNAPAHFNPSFCSMEPVYVRITAENAKSLMAQYSEYTILDVRTQEEYDEGHIENAILLPYDEVSDKVEELLTDKKAAVFLYCRSGRRSEIAARDMVAIGYNRVYDIGAYSDWTE